MIGLELVVCYLENIQHKQRFYYDIGWKKSNCMKIYDTGTGQSKCPRWFNFHRTRCRPLENRKFHLHRGQIYTSTRNGILYHSGELRSTLIVVCIDLTDYLWCISIISVLCALHFDRHSKLGFILDFNWRRPGPYLIRHYHCTDHYLTTGFNLF